MHFQRWQIIWAQRRKHQFSSFNCCLERLKDISTSDFSTPSCNPRLFSPGLFNHELSNPGLFNHELSNPRFLNPSLGLKSLGLRSLGMKSSWLKSLVMKSPGLESSWLKSLGLKCPAFNCLFFLENLKMTRKRVRKVKLALAWIYFCDFR